LINDWSLATVITAQSGVPVAVTQTTNFNALPGFGTQRPNRVGDPELPADEHAVPLVRHGGLRDRAAVHARECFAEPRAGLLIATSTGAEPEVPARERIS
jgi:hypothetical protein